MPKYLVNFKQIPVSLTLSSVDNFSFLGGVQHGSMFQFLGRIFGTTTYWAIQQLKILSSYFVTFKNSRNYFDSVGKKSF